MLFEIGTKREAISLKNLKLPLGCSDAGPGSGETESTISSLNRRLSSSCNKLVGIHP